MPSVTVELQLRWGDQDPYRHVNNVAVASLLEEARALVFWTRDSPLPALSVESPVHVLVARADISYMRPIDYRPEPLLAELDVPAVGGASFDIAYRLVQDGQACVKAVTRMAMVDGVTGSPVRLSPEVRAWLRGFAPDPEVGA